ncbi:zinc finger protein OZF-like [Centropristis striata]|uniref:zinc finger protein OZF-like n=1 Tax=Centropristis striata TaxID=184440 RepID=UPI0027E1F8B2|nr:zinc finger protein OZF-like [Centropristis striata]
MVDQAKMSSVHVFRGFVNERLAAAAEEIFGVFEKTIVEYEKEIDRQRRVLDIVWKPEIKLHRIELPQQRVCEEEEEEEEVPADQQLCIQERNSSLDQEDPEPPQVKEELKELITSQEGEQLVVKQETPTFEESDHSGDQTVYLNPDDTAAETESAVIIPVISSVVSYATSDHPLLSGDQAEPKQQKRHYRTRSHINNVSSPNLPENNCNTDQGKKSFKCDTCGKDFNHKGNLQRHQRNIHKDNRPFTCKISGKHVQSTSLVSHMRIHTVEKPFTCKICGWGFRCNSRLKQHSTIHTGEKPYSCKTCGKDFRQHSNLVLHMRIHTGEKPYACNTCKKRFADRSTCKTHMRIHTGEKPFACEVCGLVFNQRGNLRIHMRTHTGEKPYACNICEKRFAFSSTRKIHMRTHTGEKPFTCKICGTSFRCNNILKNHVKTHTG